MIWFEVVLHCLNDVVNIWHVGCILIKNFWSKLQSSYLKELPSFFIFCFSNEFVLALSVLWCPSSYFPFFVDRGSVPFLLRMIRSQYALVRHWVCWEHFCSRFYFLICHFFLWMINAGVIDLARCVNNYWFVVFYSILL